MRAKVFEKLDDLSEKDDDYVFSVMFSADKEILQFARTQFLDALNKIQKRVQDSEPQDLYQVNLDLLRWL
jgi:hypothetical protein